MILVWGFLFSAEQQKSLIPERNSFLNMAEISKELS